MNATRSGRLRAFEAEMRMGARMRGDFCRPVRMQAAGWGQEAAARAQAAWRRTFARKAVWRRALLVGMMTMVVDGMAGGHGCTVLGAIVTVGAVFVQCWQSSDEHRHAERVRLN